MSPAMAVWWRRMIPALTVAAMLLATAPVAAEGLVAMARLQAGGSHIAATEAGAELELALTQPVPWRVRLAGAPPRLVLDTREVDWQGIGRLGLSGFADLRAGPLQPGWSRLVAELPGPMRITRAGMETGDAARGGARIVLHLAATDETEFAALVAKDQGQGPLSDPVAWTAPAATEATSGATSGARRFTVVLDPGHGGLDPGAEAGSGSTAIREADLMLQFARELKEHLLRDGDLRVVLTRSEDVFVPLEQRISVARAVRADAFISLHADALSEGSAVGATVYTLASDASEAAGQALAERHDRDDLLAGIDLSGQDDVVARVLMDMARTETAPRVGRLSEALAGAISAEGIRMHRFAQQQAAFSVLKSPDVPSVLIELGFLSSPEDRQRLSDPAWRARMAEALRKGLRNWAMGEAALKEVQ